MTIEYTKEGMAVAEFEAENMARKMCEAYKEEKKDVHHKFSSEIMIEVMKLMVVEDLISNDEIQFLFEGKYIKTNKLGELEDYPKGFCDQTQGILRKLVTLRREKIKNYEKMKKLFK